MYMYMCVYIYIYIYIYIMYTHICMYIIHIIIIFTRIGRRLWRGPGVRLLRTGRAHLPHHPRGGLRDVQRQALRGGGGAGDEDLIHGA